MTNHPIYIITILLLIEAGILTAAKTAFGKKFFAFLPSMFWIYFVPMLANTAGILPAENAIYSQITRWILPAALVTLLLSADIRGILRLGPKALAVMAAGVAGIVIGAPIVTFLYHAWLPPDAWMAIGSLSGSWIGGSANMIAVKEALDVPNSVFLPAVLADPIISYFWMALLIAASTYQKSFDHWNRSDSRLLDELIDRAVSNPSTRSQWTPAGLFCILTVAVIGSIVSVYLSPYLPTAQTGFSTAVWIVILATIIGILLSFTPTWRLESRGSNTIGFILLYFVLTSIGARTSLSHIRDVPILLVAGATWIAIHALFLLTAARLLRVPLALAAAASQASIGGPASAPVVAGIYRPQLAPVGLLLAVLGNILGTFLGLFATRLCHWVW